MTKAQELANFVVECITDNQEIGGQEVTTPQWGKDERRNMEGKALTKKYRVLYINGASNTKVSGTGLILQNPDGFIIEYV